MKNPPKHLNLLEISPTFGVTIAEEFGMIILVQLEDGVATDLVKVSMDDLFAAVRQVNANLQAAQDILKEAKTATQN